MTQERTFTAEEFAQWRDHPITKAVLADLEERRRVGQEDWAAGRYPTPEANAHAIGGQMALAVVIDYLTEGV